MGRKSSYKFSLIILFFLLLGISIHFIATKTVQLKVDDIFEMGRHQWLESVNLFLEEGKILMYPAKVPVQDQFAGEEGKILMFSQDQRLEDVWAYDDQGFPLILSILGRLWGVGEMSFVGFIKFYYLLLMTMGILTSVFLFLSFRSLVISAVFYFLFLRIHIYDGVFEHHWLLGAYLPFYLAFIIFFLKRQSVFKPVLWAFYFLVAGIANIVRVGDGTAGILMLFALMIMLMIRDSFKKYLPKPLFQQSFPYLHKSVAFIILLIIIYQLPSFLINGVRLWRDARYFDGTHSEKIARHGTWDSAFKGLGYIDNSYGIKAEDATVPKFVKQVSPETKYLSHSYEGVVRKIYFEYSIKHPDLWIGNILAKFKATHQLMVWWVATQLTSNIYTNVLGNIILYVVLFLIFFFSRKEKISMLIFWVIVATLLVSMLPGLVYVPISGFMKGFLAAFFMTVFYLAILVYLRLKVYFLKSRLRSKPLDFL